MSTGLPAVEIPTYRGMTLEDFKFIYYMEYAHRMWGRLLGLAFALPAAFFAAKRMIPAPLGRRLGLLGFMGGVQGLVGWWMVRSGLQVGAGVHSPMSSYNHQLIVFMLFLPCATVVLSVNMWPLQAPPLLHGRMRTQPLAVSGAVLAELIIKTLPCRSLNMSMPHLVSVPTAWLLTSSVHLPFTQHSHGPR